MTAKKLPLFQKADHHIFRFKKKPLPYEEMRFLFIPLFITCIFLIFIIRLFQLTIVKGTYYRSLAENNRLKEISIEAPRGDILDRKGFTIVYSVYDDVTKTDTIVRIYNDPSAFAHVIGYRQKASSDDINQDVCPDERLKLNDTVGKEGIEKIYECDLRGMKGKKLIAVDAKGHNLQTINVRKPQSGKRIQTAIDSELQKKAYALLTDPLFGAWGKKSAIIVQKPHTGEILTLVSTPSFSPEDFEENNQDAIRTYLKDETQPLFNRATRGMYPPGSIFKLFVAAGAIEEKTIDEHTQIEDVGQIKAGLHTFGNWYFLQYGKTEGILNIVSALKRSNDIFFYKTGEKLGEDAIKQWAYTFGFGKKTGIELSDEQGLIPTRFWKKETLHEGWFLGDTYNLSIGQGYLLTTPLQINKAVGVFANGGYLCAPQLKKMSQGTCARLTISQKTIDLVRKGMKTACETGGTGWPFFNFKDNEQEITVGCKTGTAQSHAVSNLPHAWFTVFAPFEKPEIVLTVLVEESGEGSNIAAPIAKELLKTYFERRE
ncbi:MAG TPA: penicillin-binding transpeptidase domain-containing protein [Patescibacteria group bacterium]|nr:penicillin-binding transpeptidase domain-containing protein [Patescibacteria group bacterium]